jgi:2-methylisocitrate lyase-like PEP mutase family enzyme
VQTSSPSAPSLPSLPEQLQAATRERRAIVVPGVYDALSARLGAAAGFTALYVTGAGLANARLGVPDIGLTSVDQLVEHVEAIADAVETPLIVDADTGFGNAISVARTTRRLERAGAAAIQLEDQVFPKRCGHFEGKQVIPAAEMVAKVRAAVDSRRSEDLLIIARTDARATHGLDEAIERALAYKEAGADVIFVEAPRTEEELQEIGRRVPGPLVANMVEGGSTPIVSREDLGAWGFSIALYANAALRSAQKAVTRTLNVLADAGTTTGILDQLATWEERQNAVGKPYYDELERRYAVEADS